MSHRRTTKEHPWRTTVLAMAVLGALIACLYVAAGRDTGRGQTEAAGSGGPDGTAPTATVPGNGRGTFTPATGGSAVSGKGEPLRYAVDVEDGTGQDPRAFAREVDRILADPRGWTASGTAFQRVDRPPYAFKVHLASPSTTDRLCARFGLDTGGEVNCQGGTDVVVNLKRWLLLSPYYRDRPAAYHALIINHEVGHRLGRGHERCPGPGSPAPVMMQQIKGLHGCKPNVWPFDRAGRGIQGPAAP
ncbi:MULTISPECIES: DUF3152 domain-containing protein [Streptomyces]|uniref:DUF3152 domain-containing protein n=1 Tax=Streptomyces TaxID=1883 RepID=UPI00292CF416|nr:DUF3152 domain-containing protein [Streptomyces sp. NEAU-HV9]